MSDTTPANKTAPKTAMVAAVDPNQAFRHMIETERMNAMQHESFLKIQLDTILAELASTRTVIASCDAALERSSHIEAVPAVDPPIPQFLTRTDESPANQ